MAEKRGGSHSLNSIFLEDFEENKELAETYVDLDGAAGGNFNDAESESVFMKRTEIEEELKRKEALAKLFGEDEGQSASRTHSARVSNVAKPAGGSTSQGSGTASRTRSASKTRTASAGGTSSGTRTTSGGGTSSGTRTTSSTGTRSTSTSASTRTASADVQSSGPIENPTSSPRLKKKTAEEVRYTPKRSSVTQVSRTHSESSGTQNSDAVKRAASLRSIQNEGEYSREEGSRYSGRTSNKKKVQYEKPKTTGQKVAKFAIFFVLWLGVFIVCVVGYKYAYKIFNDLPMDPTDLSKVEITLTGDETDEEVGEILKENGLIDDVDLFKLRCKIYDAKYYPGTWKLSRSFNTEKNLNILAGYNYATGRMEEVTTAEETSETTAETAAETAEGGEAAPAEGEAAEGGEAAPAEGEAAEGGGEDGENYEDGGEDGGEG